MRYLPLFDVRIRHPYHEGGRCTDFDIVPTADTLRAITNHRCLWRGFPDGGRVVAQVDSGARMFLPLEPAVDFTFDMRLTNTAFAMFTDLTDVQRHGSPVFTSADRGAPDAALRLTGGDARPGAPAVFARIRIHSAGEFAADHVLGDAPREFRVEFAPLAARWAYYFVTNLREDLDDLEIASTASEPLAPRFTASRVALGESDARDPLVAELAADYSQLRRFRFLSDEPVACRDAPRRSLSLKRGEDSLVSPLPNPSIRNRSTLGDGSQSESTLFHVIKYVTQDTGA